MDRVARKKAQSVVHPAHVPFEAEAEAAEIGGARNGGPGRGLFSDGENPGESAVGDFVHALEEIDGVEVFAASELIGDPLAGLARVVEIKHGGDGVHAETVDVVFVEPKEGVRNQIVLDFVAAVIVNEGAPVGMRALSRVGVFVEMRAIELSEAVSVAREMRGSPIENDADAGLVAAVDEFHELSGRAVAAGGREIAESLVAPGAVVGMLHDGKQLDVGVAEVFEVRNELASKFAVIQPAVVVFGDAAPGAEMNFVYGDGRFEPVFLRAARNPIGIVPLISIQAGDDGASLRA